MKKTWIAALILVLVLSMTACGAGEAKTLTGTWKVDSVEVDGAEFSLAEMEAMGESDLSQTQIVIKDGGKAYVAEPGYSNIVDWSETKNGICLDGEECEIKDGMICLDTYEGILRFKKVSDSQVIEKPAEPEDQTGTAEPEDKETEPAEAESVFSPDAEPVDGEVYVSEDFEFVQYTDGSIALTKYVGKDTSVTISAEIAGYPVSRIGAGAFEDCGDVEKIFLWADIISIGEGAFRNCTKLDSFTIPDTVTAIADAAFENCTSMKSVYIWGDITGIGNSAFRSCAALESVNIPASCEAIGESAFEGCTSLESAYIWGETTSIGSSAFRSCAALERVTIPTECRTIGESAFEGCTSLESVTYWGENVTCGADAFADCPNLKKLPKGIIYAKGTSDEKPKTDAPAAETEPTAAETGTTGMRPEFKEAMDAYEAFYDEYCDFMAEYQKNPTDLKLVTQYGKLLIRMAEADAAFGKWEESDLNDAELKYYLEVNNRVMQKLVDAAG